MFLKFELWGEAAWESQLNVFEQSYSETIWADLVGRPESISNWVPPASLRCHFHQSLSLITRILCLYLVSPYETKGILSISFSCVSLSFNILWKSNYSKIFFLQKHTQVSKQERICFNTKLSLSSNKCCWQCRIDGRWTRLRMLSL